MKNSKEWTIVIPPPKEHDKLTFSKLLQRILRSNALSYSMLCEALADNGRPNIDENTIKSWLSRDVKTLSNEKLRSLHALIEERSLNSDIKDKWIYAFSLALAEDPPKNYSKIICQNVLSSNYLTKLPSLFGTEQSLPLAHAYTELSITTATPSLPNPSMLELNLTLGQRLRKRAEARFAISKSPKDFLDENIGQKTLILGPPGAGKSSMLRQITLDIADGNWKALKTPVFAEARAYWARRKKDSSINLLSFALKAFLPLEEDADRVLESLLTNEKKSKLILLFDGLDEIASDEDAVSTIYDELKMLPPSISVIVTARPAGLMGSIGESNRYEMVDLNDEAIEGLIDNWCESMGDTSNYLDSEGLKIEIFSSHSTRDMASNPFLLTSLCFLKMVNPDNKLPTSRIGVYESLQAGIIRQAQSKNPHVLSELTVEALENFTFALYNQPSGESIQVFRKNKWRAFTQKEPKYMKIDFESQIKPSRLLSVWGGNDPYYHFLHLSLQEYLIARAMLERPLEDALTRRFMPSWRAVFRFYGSLLYQRGFIDEFRQLVNSLHREKDLTGLSLLTLVDVFSYAGIQNTKEWIGEDLKKTLYNVTNYDDNLISEAMLNGVTSLAPEWLEKQVNSAINNGQCSYINNFKIGSLDTDECISTKQIIEYGSQVTSPFYKLAQTKTGSAKRTIKEYFWGKDQNLALLSAYAFALVATPKDRSEVVKASEKATIFDDMAIRIFTFIQYKSHSDFLPFLEKVITYATSTMNSSLNDALNIIADIGNDDASKILELQLVNEANKLSEEFNSFELSLQAVTRLGGDKALRILERTLELTSVSEWHETIVLKCLEASPNYNSKIIEALNRKHLQSEMISTLCNAAQVYSRLPDDEMIQMIIENVDISAINDLSELATIEYLRINAGMQPQLCSILLDIAKHLHTRIQNPDDDNDKDYMLSQLSEVFSTLAIAKWEPAQELVRDILFDSNSNRDMQALAIWLSGYVFYNTADKKILSHLKDLLYLDLEESIEVDGQAVATAMGLIDINELFYHQGAYFALDALQEIAAEQDLFIFDHFWCDRFGQKRNWEKPPLSVLHIYDEDDSELVSIFSHEMSKFGLKSIFNDGANDCIAFLIYSPTSDYALKIADQVETKNKKDSNYLLFNIGSGLSDETAISLARSIGELLFNRHKR